MKTLKEISLSNPSTYKVIDGVVNRGEIKTNSDRIEIMIFGKNNKVEHKNTTRKYAAKFGLCEPIQTKTIYVAVEFEVIDNKTFSSIKFEGSKTQCKNYIKGTSLEMMTKKQYINEAIFAM